MSSVRFMLNTRPLGSIVDIAVCNGVSWYCPRWMSAGRHPLTEHYHNITRMNVEERKLKRR